MAKRKTDKDKGSKDRVRSALRALRLLEMLNRRSISSIEDLASATGLAKSTVARLLATLAADGYVVQLPRRRGYTLGERVVRLASGYRARDAVVQAATPILSAFTAKHGWAVTLATRDHDAMRVRYSTNSESPFSVDEDWTNRRAPILASAVGRAYLAFCPSEERATIAALLRASRRVADRPAREADFVTRVVQEVRRKGYALTAPTHGSRTTGFAVPVMQGKNVIATITMPFFSAITTERDVADRYLELLRTAAESIAAAVRPAGSGI
jgi:IclR family mhp operon transcriptional activator